MEILASELRIGNWLSGIATGLSIKVDLHFFNEIFDDDTALDWYKGIPLTPEILEKCGFVNNPYQDRYEFGYIYVEYCGVRNLCWIDGKPHIEYLHQLQNYVYINTNEELTFKP